MTRRAKILELDLREPIGDLEELGDYECALVLLTYEGFPVGQVWCPIHAGRISTLDLRDRILHTDPRPMQHRIVAEFLALNTRQEALRQAATVATVTRDRPDDLSRCLDALMRLPDDGQEILVVDNCPASDESRDLVNERYGGHVRYMREMTPGASAARNRALREARHEIVAFTDDDAAPDTGWLRALLANFSDPQVLGVTGLIVPAELETPAQLEYERFTPLGRGFSRQVFDQEKCDPLHAAPVGVSASLALRREVLDVIGGFDELLGVGTPCRGGEDFELFARIMTSGYRMVYEPRAVSRHRHCRSRKKLLRTVFGYGVGAYSFWTRQMLVDREFSVPLRAWGWLRHIQLPNLLRSLFRRPGSFAADLVLAELVGCLCGPWVYLRSRLARRWRTDSP